MSYVDAVLQPGETVRHRGRLHWVLYAKGLAVLAVAAALALLPVNEAQRAPLHWGAALVAAVGLLLLAKSWFDQAITEIAVTDRRVIYKRGLIQRHTAEMNVDKVETVNVDQSIMGRVLGYGTVDLRGTGGGIEGIRTVADPLVFRSAITARVPAPDRP